MLTKQPSAATFHYNRPVPTRGAKAHCYQSIRISYRRRVYCFATRSRDPSSYWYSKRV